ncbi:hypothetical protein ZWY2020_043126, partial [Hordeum vulgare]
MDVLYKARKDDGDSTKKSWVLLELATVLTLSTGNMVPLECLKSLEEMDKVISMYHLILPQVVINEHQLNYSLPRASFVHQSDFDLVLEFDKNKLCLGKSSFGNGMQFWPLSETPYATLSPKGPITGVAVGNISVAAQDVDCDDTQDCGVEDVNINENQDDVGAKDNPIEDSNPTKNGKSVEEDVCELYAAELKWATNSYVQVLQAMHCRRLGQLLKDVQLASSSNQQATDVTFDIPPHCNNDVHKINFVTNFLDYFLDGSPKPQEEPAALVSTREPSPNRYEDKLRLKDEKKVKSKKRAGSPISAGQKYKKIKTYSKTEAIYKYFVMKTYKMKKMKKGEIEPPFIRIGDLHITCTDFQKSLKPHAQMCNEVTSLFKVFDPSVCAKQLRRLFFTIVRGGHWIVCVVNLLHKEFNLFNSLDNGNLYIAAKNLFTNFKRIDAEERDFTVDLTSFKLDLPLLDYPQQSNRHINLLSISFLFWKKNNFDSGYFGVLYFENFDDKRMKDFKK